MIALNPRLFVIKVGRCCYITEENGKEWTERKYMLTRNIQTATFYDEYTFSEGVVGIRKKAYELGGEAFEVFIGWPEENAQNVCEVKTYE